MIQNNDKQRAKGIVDLVKLDLRQACSTNSLLELEYEKEKLKLIVKIKILDKDLKEVQISTIHSNVDNATANMIKQKLKEVEKEGIPCKTNF